VDFENPKNNEFLVVNQFTVIEGQNLRPDIVIFVNAYPWPSQGLRMQPMRIPPSKPPSSSFRPKRMEFSLFSLATRC